MLIPLERWSRAVAAVQHWGEIQGWWEGKVSRSGFSPRSGGILLLHRGRITDFGSNQLGLEAAWSS